MSGHSHDHGGHSHSGGGGGDCGHEHFTHEAGEQQSLYSVIDSQSCRPLAITLTRGTDPLGSSRSLTEDNVVALNAESDEMGKAIIKCARPPPLALMRVIPPSRPA